jgi:hypothetical protein
LGQLILYRAPLRLGVSRLDQELQTKKNYNAHGNELTETGSTLNKLFDKHS